MAGVMGFGLRCMGLGFGFNCGKGYVLHGFISPPGQMREKDTGWIKAIPGSD
jgi:hypothetical protein